MGAIKTRRIKDDVIMNMRLIRMSRYDKSMIAFGKSHKPYPPFSHAEHSEEALHFYQRKQLP